VSEQQNDRVRLDKWLWAARFFKARSLAREAIDGGKVHYNEQRCKPGKVVEVGARLDIQHGGQARVVIVRAISDQRQSAPIAQQLYEETPESLVRREEIAEARRLFKASQPVPFRRPTKRDRRLITRFKQEQNNHDEH
jgi:ribosome-associated heat shock protein Hsp15